MMRREQLLAGCPGTHHPNCGAWMSSQTRQALLPLAGPGRLVLSFQVTPWQAARTASLSAQTAARLAQCPPVACPQHTHAAPTLQSARRVSWQTWWWTRCCREAALPAAPKGCAVTMEHCQRQGLVQGQRQRGRSKMTQVSLRTHGECTSILYPSVNSHPSRVCCLCQPQSVPAADQLFSYVRHRCSGPEP